MVREQRRQRPGDEAPEIGRAPAEADPDLFVLGRAPHSYDIAIQKTNASQAPRFDLFVSYGPLEHIVEAGSLPEPASSPPVVAVGAICWKNDAHMFYSSQGLTIDNRIKPDLVAPSHVSSGVSKYGKFKDCSANNFDGGFGGTSASAPHVTAAAALLKQANPNLKVNDLRALLEKKVIDLGAAGKDNLFGEGKLWLGTPPPSLQLPPGAFKITSKQARDSLEAEFEAAARGCDRCTVTWFFGDGQTGVGNPVRHAYREPGWYRVSAHFTDAQRLVRATSELIRVH